LAISLNTSKYLLGVSKGEAIGTFNTGSEYRLI
jgi:hypothetical protein